MKLTTLNVQGFDNWDERKNSILLYLTQQDSDIVFFQEVVYLPEISPFTPVELLNQSLKYPYQHNAISRLQVGLHYPVYREGMAILSKHPILKSDILVLKKEERDEHTRIVQMADILIDDEVIKVANVHFSITDFFDLATPQLKETLEILKARGETRILMGDFNITFLEETAELWQDDYVASTEVPYITYPTMNKRVEYALIPKSYKFKNITTSDDSLSDHRALSVEIVPVKAVSRSKQLRRKAIALLRR
ncbi:MAG: endonuclease/exonuclease/phosphatase family protein [Patescibacteria group bacterium]